MATKIPKVSIVCPAFQEEEVLPHFHQELARVLLPLADRYEIEIIYVDDGSRDRTLPVIKELAAQDGRIRCLSFSRNFGHQAALTAGLEHASGAAVIMMDSDLQHPPALIPALLEKWHEGYEVVVTIREEDPDLGFFKRVTSRLFYQVMGRLSDTEIRFAASDYRLMSRRAVDGLLQMQETHRFLRGMVQWLGFSTVEVAFKPARRKAGVSKYNVRRMVNFAVDALISFSKVPLRVSLVIGLISTAFSLAYAVYAAVRCLVLPEGFQLERAFLLVSLYLIGGCILCGLGFVGEYVGRIYEQVKARPIYVLKESWCEGMTVQAGPGFDKKPTENTAA